MLVRLQRLLEAFTLKRRLAIVLLHQPGIADHAVNTGRAYCHDVGIKHHEGEPPIAFERVLWMEVGDGLFFPALKPPITWNVAVVLFGLAIPSPPIVELALSDSQPIYEVVSRQLGTLRPAVNVVDDGIASVVGDPGATQSPPSSFFS